AEDNFEVEEIVHHEHRPDSTYYLLRWSGYPEEDDTWEPADHVQESTIQEYWDKHKGA
ncbi:hypothetical protein SJAG_06608, partial [Schizosaccharomyces japonicus yFS275]